MHASFNKTWGNYYWHRGSSSDTPLFIYSCSQFAQSFIILYTVVKLTRQNLNQQNLKITNHH